MARTNHQSAAAQGAKEFLKAFEVETQALSLILKSFQSSNRASVEKALELFIQSPGKVITTGVGKSGLIARKAASTFTSTGTISLFLHPSEALHGDLGLVSSEDVVLVFGKSGESSEISSLLPSLKNLGCKIVSITSREDSSLAKASDVVLLAKVDQEACPFDLAPTASTTASLVVADALAIALMKAKKFSAQSFAALHPGGSLGFRLQASVESLMISLKKHAPLNAKTAKIEEVISHLGLVGLVVFSNKSGVLQGIMTDGDVRRLLAKYKGKIFNQKLEGLITKNPLFVEASMTAHEALQFMENRERPLNAVPVVKDKKVVGVLRLHDLLKS